MTSPALCWELSGTGAGAGPGSAPTHTGTRIRLVVTLKLGPLDGEVAGVGKPLHPRKSAVQVDSLTKFSLKTKPHTHTMKWSVIPSKSPSPSNCLISRLFWKQNLSLCLSCCNSYGDRQAMDPKARTSKHTKHTHPSHTTVCLQERYIPAWSRSLFGVSDAS